MATALSVLAGVALKAKGGISPGCSRLAVRFDSRERLIPNVSKPEQSVMIVVFDTNIWLSELGFNSSVGAAVRFYLRTIGVRVALPEVVRLEATHQFTQKLSEFVDDIQNNYSKLLTVFGSLKDIALPTHEQIQDCVARLFDELSVELIDIPFTITSAKHSFLKTIKSVPPSGPKNQQFKDGVLWADCLELLDKDDVCIVTTDKRFFENHNYEEGLSKSLLLEAKTKPHKIMLFHELNQLLGDIQTEIDLDKAKLAQSYVAVYRKSIGNLVAASGYELGRLIEVQTKLFITEHPEKLYIEFHIKYSCPNIISEDLPQAQLSINGYGTYSAVNQAFVELEERDSELSYTTEDGTLQRKHSITPAVDGIIIGHRSKMHTIRRLVD